MGIFDRFQHPGHEADTAPAPAGPTAPTVVQIDASQLSRVFSAPLWLRDLGLLAWFLVGVALVLVGATWLLSITSTIVDPVVVGTVVAAVAAPVVSWLQRPVPARGRGGDRAARVHRARLPHLRARDRRDHRAVRADQGGRERGARQDPGLVQRQRRQRHLRRASGTAHAVSVSGSTLLQGVASGIEGLTSWSSS